MEDERFRLRSTESTVRTDLLLERGDFTELRIELADQQEVEELRHGARGGAGMGIGPKKKFASQIVMGRLERPVIGLI